MDYGKSFGADKAIILENNLVRSFEISKYSVVYEDNEIQTFSDPFFAAARLRPFANEICR